MTLAITTMAQIAPGTIRVGGSGLFDHQKSEFIKLRTTQLDAAFGVFVAENLNVGFNISVVDQFFSYDYGFFSGSSGETYAVISPELRYYIDGKIIVGAQYPIDMQNASTNKGPLKFQVGYAAFISEKVAFEPVVYYGAKEGVSNVGIQIGFSIFL